MKIAYKTNHNPNNIISNKIEQYNKHDTKEVYKLTCTNCNKFYIATETSTQDSKNIGKTSDTQKANPNSP